MSKTVQRRPGRKPGIRDRRHDTLTLRLKRFVELLPANNWNIYKSGIAAGFTESYSRHHLPALTVSKVALSRAIDAKRAEIEEINRVDSNFVKGEHLRLLDLSEAKGDLATATRNVEALGKTIGAYKEVHEDYLFPGRRPEDPVAESEAKRKAFVASQVVADKASSLPKRVVPKDAPVQVDAPQKKPEKPTGRSDTFLTGEPSTVKVDTPQDVLSNPSQGQETEHQLIISAD